MAPDPYPRRKVAKGKARFVSGAAAHFSFLVHSPNVMKECTPTPPDGCRLDPLKPGVLRKATIMAGVTLLELSRAAGARLMGAGSKAEARKGFVRVGCGSGRGIGNCDFHDVKAMPEE